ncbi:MAG: adenylyltransferase/cytidyltransferase family protein [Bacteroidota bacterium]
MKIHYSFDSITGIRNPVVTTGTFDGVHIGHQVIIRRLKKLASVHHGETVLITFHPHPRRVLYPEGKGKDLLLICSQKEKKMLLEETGLDHLVIIPFTPEFSKISSRQFVENLLVGKLNARVIVVGFNHHFGHNREGDFSYLYQLSRYHGFEVEEIPEQDIHHETVSSTKIRKALLEGNIQRANAYLDHYYILNGKLNFYSLRSEQFQWPVYKVHIEENVKLIPPDGVYAVNIQNGESIEKGLFSINRWELEKNVLSPATEMECSFLNENFNPEGKALNFYFHKKVRNGSIFNDERKVKQLFFKDLGEIEELIY